MRRTLCLVLILSMFFSIGCAVRARYYSRPGYGPYDYQHHRHDHDRDDYRRR
jgi:hypothetical protein